MNGFDWTPALTWLANYLLHSTVLLSAAWLAEAAGLLRAARGREFVWRVALAGGLLTASVHTFAPGVSLTGQPGLPAAPQPAVPANVLAPAAVPDGVADTAADTADTVERPAATPKPAGTTKRFPFELPVANLLLALWAAGAAANLLRLANTGRLARRELRGREPVASGPLHERLAALCRRADAGRVPALSVLDGLPGPVTLPNGEICLPRWTVETLSPRALDAVLAHELAHIRRRDPLALLAVTLLDGLLFLQPLNRLAHRRLAALAELNADAFAARLTGNPRALAEALAQCARRLHDTSSKHHALHAGVAMATRRSPLIGRVERLLGGISMQDQHVSRFTRIFGVAALVAAVVALPAFAPAVAERTGTHVSIRHGGDSGEMRLEIGKPGYFLHVETDGEVAFNEQENDIASLEEDSRILIREKRDGTLHELEITNDDGELVREYSRDRDAMPPDAEARAWLGRVIPEILRNTTINAEARIARIHAAGGNGAVLDELGLIESDHVLAHYVALFAGNYELDERETTELLRRLDSLGSDFELRQALAAVIGRQPLDDAGQAQLLKVASSIGSDFELAELVAFVTPDLADNADNLKLWRQLVASIGSDFEQRRALTPLLQRELPREWKLAALQLAREGIGSDFELRSLLQDAAPLIGDDRELVEQYVAAVKSIGSDFEAREAVVALARNARLDVEGYSRLLDAVNGIGSDFEASQALQTIAAKMPREDSLVQKYRRVAEGLSEHEQRQAERALR